MKKILIGFALALLISPFFASSALAQEETVIKGKDKTVFKKKTVVDFEDSTVEGELVRPEGGYILNRGRAKFNSLIRYRPHFVKEMWKAARKL